jgi:hypothetical protein
MTKRAKILIKTLTRITAFALLALSGVYFLRMNSASRLRLFLPRYSPATQAALYDLDRFLGLMARDPEKPAHRERPPGSLQPHAASLE